ncbi:ABC transporter substrate-binding protein [Undibacterium arcticum]|uniref:ABC transporter substrate-binding protein n=1 Tax=Undibacterium arcticum TaxID=1762892 RepID=A0ABV7EZB7_9BURK
MKSTLTWICALFAGLTCCGAALAGDVNPDLHAGNPIRIGDINSYSNAPQITEPYRNGWQLALDEVNAAGGVNGRKLEVIARDDGGKPDQAIRQAQDLLTTVKVDVLTGSFMSNIGLALAGFALHNKKLFVAAEPLSDAITWDRGNRYTFRMRPSTYMQTAMLVEQAAKLPARRWAVIAPNYEYGQSAALNFKLLLKAKRPDVIFVADQWPTLGKLDAAATVAALARQRPDAIFNACFGADLGKFVQEGNARGLFAKVTVVSLLSGEPENLSALDKQAVKGWIVTGYPWDQINTPEHRRFAVAYVQKYHDHPSMASVVGYSTLMAVAQAIKKAQSTDAERLVLAMRGLTFDSPLGPVMFRAIDQQSTMGTYVGTLEQIDGKNVMRNWHYADGKGYQPDDAAVRARRPAAAMK